MSGLNNESDFQPTRYFQDISNAAFEDLLPPKLRTAPFVAPGTQLNMSMPKNAVMIKVTRLTQEINRRLGVTGAPPTAQPTAHYIVRRVIIHQTFASAEVQGSIADCEVWLHRSGRSHGKVINLQVGIFRRAPFLRMLAVRVTGEQPEDSMLLLANKIS